MNKYKLGVIGAGNMSSAITKGILTSSILKPEEMLISDISEEKLNKAQALGMHVTRDNVCLAENVDYLLFAVKPQSFPDIASAIKGRVAGRVISIMAGITVSTLQKSLLADKICRVMPNTPCMIGSGMCALCFVGYSEEEKRFPLSVFSGLGEIIELEEKKFDAVTSVSGSGPAYAYMFAEGMIRGGMNGGLSYEEAKKLTLATLIGGARMVSLSEKPIPDLIDAVCSKGGTTIQAVTHYRMAGLEDIIAEGVDRCRARSVEMSNPGGESMLVRMYTDGACSGNPGPGGYAAILTYGDKEKVISGGEPSTTNNRMELLAVIKGLESLVKRCVVEVHSDSAYVVNAINNDWLKKWASKKWENVKNPDLWAKLTQLLACHDVRFIKVKGHSDDEMNNRCDEIARKESRAFLAETE